jgi:histidinol-phosphate aminotransferase
MQDPVSLSRRRFAGLLGAGAACVLARPALSLTEPSMNGTIARTVRLNSNENPYGPSPMAIKAMTRVFNLAWRYPDEYADLLVEIIARVNGVNRDQILLGDGSGEILKMCASAFTGPMTNGERSVELAKPTRGGALQFVPGRGKIVVADPTFEAILNHARVNGAEVAKIPLSKNSFAHDLDSMLAAASEGLIYICNPNNPTASITPKNDLREFIRKTPEQTVILVDEAYFHYADSQDHESVIPLIKDHPNLIVARTFSKIYGMAGLRCGYCIARKETIQRMRPHQTWDSVNIMALAAAVASLNDPDQVTRSRRLNRQVKFGLTRQLDSMGYKYIPSQANFMMIDVQRPVRPVIEGLNKRGVSVGRAFPTLPTHLRVTIGKQAEMDTFLSAFREVLHSRST